MRVLIACEESQTVCKAFRELGHEAYSCDIQESSGGRPEWHIKGDVLNYLKPTNIGYGEKPGINFVTEWDTYHIIGPRWDLIIAHPPCTDLAVSGARHFAKKIENGSQQKSIEFFMKLANADCDRICVENPVSIMSTKWRKPDQIIQPYEFGHPHKKTTCLWLKGLPKLIPTEIVDVCDFVEYKKSDGTIARYSDWYNKGGKNRAKLRSKTFEGIAKAMASQWSDL